MERKQKAMNYTDEQIKSALAKMLPKTCYMNEGGGTLYYQPDKLTICYSIHPSRVLDTELLHLCWLVEKVLIENDKQAYNLFENRLFELCNPYTTLSATWQQRVAALAEVKGIKL